MHAQARNHFIQLYEKDLRLLANDICKKCNATIRHPLLPWQVGRSYWSSRHRILFVGKPHRGIPVAPRRSGILDATEKAKGYFFEYQTAYWAYTREIVARIYGSDTAGWEHIAFTNLVKCTNVEGEDPGNAGDGTTPEMASACVSDLKVIVHEIRYLKPRHIVFYTSSFFSDLLRTLPLDDDCTWSDITSFEHRVPCGAKHIGWWERECSTSWCSRVRVLVVAHPERKRKDTYVGRIVRWIQNERA